MIEYIENPPTEDVLRRFLKLLACEPKELLHPGAFGELERNIEEIDSADALVSLLLEHPEVMNRPVIVRGDQAVIARPSEKVREILD